MLQIKEISKEYKTGNLVQKALDHVSLNLRDNEFVAILGPSGSGKTTLLNIIGGLDRYDSGDLIINGISTKQYKDRDWDSYRNHTIGFVFQSYNLIPHQTVLANVELALTISGISGAERRERALDALDKVGLKEQAHKKPSQMSGGQMQRVAIARALVNDPQILLADEPTGALDSETSVQVMDLLQEVASDRLVVMVTHNPELAEQYATRIVNLKDGVIRSDTNPYEVEEDTEAVHKNMGHSSMSLLTALSLSFNNLRTKMTRTLLVSFAGSIGIIGIALIISLSNGVNKYIKDTEEETLLGYPVQITSTSFDLSAMVAQNAEAQSSTPDEEERENDVRERAFINRMLSRTKSNDLGALRTFFETESDIRNYTSAIEYSYPVTPHIYRINPDDSFRQVNPDSTFSVMGIGGSSSFSAISSLVSTNVFYSLPKEENLYKNIYDIKAGHWPENDSELVLLLYPDGSVSDFLLYILGIRDSDELDRMIESFMKEEKINADPKGEWFSYDDFLGITFKLVNSADYYRYDSEHELWVDKSDDDEYMRQLVRGGEDLKIVGVIQQKEDSDVTLLTPGIYYSSGLKLHVVDMSLNSRITEDQLANETVNVFTGRDFTDTEQPEMDFSDMFSVNTELLGNAFKFDTSKFQFDASMFSGLTDFSGMDLSSVMSPEQMKFDMSSMPEIDFMKILSSFEIKVDFNEAVKLAEDLFNGYLDYAQQDPSTDFRSLPQAIQSYLLLDSTRGLIEEELKMIMRNSGYHLSRDDLNESLNELMDLYMVWQLDQADPGSATLQDFLASEAGEQAMDHVIAELILKQEANAHIRTEDVEHLIAALVSGYQDYAILNPLVPNPQKILSSFQAYMESTGRKKIEEGAKKIINLEEIQSQAEKVIAENSTVFGEAIGKMLTGVITELMTKVSDTIASSMEKAMGQFASGIQDAISFDTEVFAKAFTMSDTDGASMEELFASMINSAQYTYDSNLQRFGYADLNKPSSVSIYPLDFESKAEVIRILDEYNERMKAEDEDKVITYTDIVGALMSSVTTIVDMISNVLIAFVAISLVVSSIMIGVITYISVLERRKEIGILRAIGASKWNISEVFNAETFIIGLLAGVMGVGISWLLLIPGNYLVHTIAGNTKLNAYLPLSSALVLILLSVVLTLIGGIIPSRKAARSDPVTALRTE